MSKLNELSRTAPSRFSQRGFSGMEITQAVQLAAMREGWFSHHCHTWANGHTHTHTQQHIFFISDISAGLRSSTVTEGGIQDSDFNWGKCIISITSTTPDSQRIIISPGLSLLVWRCAEFGGRSLGQFCQSTLLKSCSFLNYTFNFQAAPYLPCVLAFQIAWDFQKTNWKIIKQKKYLFWVRGSLECHPTWVSQLWVTIWDFHKM